MSSPDKKKRNWKKFLFEELVEYWVNVIYLALVFAAFTQYRRIILAAYDITYTNYWIAVIEALILAKVIMIGAVFRLGRGLRAQAPDLSHPVQDGRLHSLCRCFYPRRAHGQGSLAGKGAHGGYR